MQISIGTQRPRNREVFFDSFFKKKTRGAGEASTRI